MLNTLTDHLSDWADGKKFSHDFISAVASDLKEKEESVRQKVYTATLVRRSKYISKTIVSPDKVIRESSGACQKH